jgi:hypothetical protein
MPDQQGFYSKLEEVVNAKLPKVASPQQVLASVDPAKGSGVKPEELKWTGFAQAVERIAKENGGKVPKDQLMQHLKNEGAVRFEEVTTEVKGKTITQEEVDRLERRAQRTQSNADWSAYEDAVLRFESQELGTEAQYSRYQLPGGENYREVVLTSDIAAPYTSSHFKEIPNYVAHMRVNERADASGKPGLFVEEIQSDRHQQAREQGYKEDKGTDWSKVPVYQYKDLVSGGVFPEVLHIEVKDGIYKLVAPDGGVHLMESSLEKLKKNYDRSRMVEGVSDAPFRKDWSLQMFKRALRDAVASGKEWIGWTTGETQADRFDLSKQVDYIDYRRVGPDKYDVSVVGKNGTDLFSETGINQSRVSDAVGKEIADKIAKGEGQSGGGRMTLRGLDLKVGGEGMKGFYDKILPTEIQKYVKQWGGEIKKQDINTGQGKPTEYADFASYQKASKESQKTPIWRVNITPEMRKSVSQSGQPRFMPSDTDYLSAVKQGDTQAAQRMVDEAAKAAGYTVGPVFHRTSAKNISKFRPWVNFGTEEQSANVDLTGRGEGDTRTYEAYLNLSNPIRVRDEGMAASNVLQQAREQRVVSGEEMASFPYNRGDDVERAYVAKVLEKNGFDGIVYENEYEGYGDSYIALKPSQIKSADTITKDNAGNVIPLSQRFKATSEDIRFMPGGIDESTGLPLNKDGTVTVYHHTNKKSAQSIQSTGILKSAGEPDVYVTTETNPVTGYGSDVVKINVDPARLQIDDEFPDGRKDFRLSVGKPGGSIRVNVIQDPRFIPSPDSAMPGAYTFTGGYRALPGKTKGSLRIYGPAGSLLGIASSLDEAQRIIRKKAK